MPRYLLVAYFFFFLIIDSICQVYHFETGKVLPINEPDKIVWKQGIYKNYPADFGTLIVKENRQERSSRLINIPIIRIKAFNQDTVLNPIFLLNGGPGESNFQPQLFFEELIQHHDLVLVGYRGVDGSVRLDCPCMKNALLSETLSLNNYTQVFKQAVDSCYSLWNKQKIDIQGYSMDEVVQDIEIIRILLGYDKIDFLAFSYGTMLSHLYNNNYPYQVDKMALIGARPLNNFLFEGVGYNKQIFDIYKHYSLPDSLIREDEMKAILAEVELILNSIIENNREINPYRLLFFGFSKLYSMIEIEKVFRAYSSADQENFETLNKLYYEFYRNFPGNIVLGDIFLKKQGRVDFTSNINDSTIGHEITKVVNSWYTPEIELLKNRKIYKTSSHKSDSTYVLFISGEFDVASPPQYLNDTLYFNYSNIQKVQIPNSGHLDLFDSKTDSVENVVIKFFK